MEEEFPDFKLVYHGFPIIVNDPMYGIVIHYYYDISGIQSIIIMIIWE